MSKPTKEEQQWIDKWDDIVESHTRRELLIDLNNTNPYDGPEFHRLIHRTLNHLNISVSELAEHLDMSISSVARWTEGKTAPTPSMRPTVYAKLRKLVNPSSPGVPLPVEDTPNQSILTIEEMKRTILSLIGELTPSEIMGVYEVLATSRNLSNKEESR